jgi:hypothetical protein
LDSKFDGLLWKFLVHHVTPSFLPSVISSWHQLACDKLPHFTNTNIIIWKTWWQKPWKALQLFFFEAMFLSLFYLKAIRYWLVEICSGYLTALNKLLYCCDLDMLEIPKFFLLKALLIQWLMSKKGRRYCREIRKWSVKVLSRINYLTN